MNIKHLSQLCCVAIITAATFSCTPKTAEEKLDSTLKEAMEKNRAIGMAVAAVKDGKIIFAKSFGYKDRENKIELKNDDLFRIASISKSFTATAIMQMVEQGKIDLEGDVSKYLGFPIRNPTYPTIPITIRMLLSHSSSLNDSEGYFTINVINPDSSSTHINAYSDWEPGTKYDYCNLGFNTLGTILERVSGERFDQYIVNHILKPVGAYGGYNVGELDSTKFVTLYEEQPDGSFTPSPDAYAKRTAQIANYHFGYSAPIFSPTGGMKISATDLAKVMMMHMNLGKIAQPGSPDSLQVIDRHSAELMQTKMISPTAEGDSYGFALRISDRLIDGKTMIGHTGSAYGVYTTMFWDQERKNGFVVLISGCKSTRNHTFIALNRQATNAMAQYLTHLAQ
ncbi:MAG: serine hydrolase domain-containing protein [Bacteroidales bacterium]